ncbi:Acs Acyl-coenzyme A synthetases/AMP-(fatty) acid ligases [uncultured Caudovirales phage]|uniref:Acs Acyl-coenzyme A synthetases/AMP-(Fatty) acid ligases n=1 Tax=uncultured Caudovirales phage TaxID=2100421 RepID=A0A6J5NWQ5_9CAUD|nr:Acs Acyl-coenzyme A synthetases/AMP-(fatty) acid ligases [uncultured Caudovirales phage]CAB4165851.1 Acs Acyl-coenzyme A synthetases/AMP-(fatty) acid ligases [uncultured Caudovirales phage]CAB4186919.1 Acs Acyl-coenzyme A synthetases/AMP-(fatty) acid ligases [uncultured Caudovirales phage]CAB4221398.1 Acs Acyl-coenzyme A synthetases/AMP-(fatty) acid ligases [uncultured Caudovirales phage]
MSNTINIDMKRVVLCVPDPWNYYDQFEHCCIMTVNPDNTPARQKYLLDNSDWSIKVTQNGVEYRDGGDYPNEKIFWYTSGTTGDSKFYSFSQAQIDHCVDTIIQAYSITANDRYVGIMPLWHAHGQAFYWLTKRIKCQAHFMSVPELRNMPKYSPTFITAVPDMLKVVSQLDFDQNLRFIRSASVALPDQLFQTLKDKFNLPIIEAFGMTESLSHCFTNPLDGEQRIGTVGLPSGIEANIVDHHLMIRGPGVYKNDWIDTGDLAEQDSAGYYRILGRSIDQLNIKGKKFNPVSLESQALKHIPTLKECVIFGDNELNCLYVGECDPTDIQQVLLRLDKQLKPVFLNKIDEIPLKYPGKISRNYLKKLFNCK